MLCKATAHAWFKSHRPCLAPLHGESLLQEVDGVFAKILEMSDKHGSRPKYLDLLKALKGSLSQLRTKAMLHVGAAPVVKPNFGLLIGDQKMRDILDRRWTETISCIEVGSHLAATVMMGALLEAILLARINTMPDRAPAYTAKAAPRDKLGKTKVMKEWGLKDFLDVAHELAWIRQSAKDVGDVLRDYRNYIHPEKELSHGAILAAGDTSIFLNVFCSLAEQVIQSAK